MVLPRKRAV